MKTIITIVIVLLVIAGIYYYMSDHSKQADTPLAPAQNTTQTVPSQTTNAVVPATTSQAEASVDIKSFSFVPASLSVAAGTKITWTNHDSVPHTVTSDSDTIIDSPTLAPGQSYSVVIPRAGTFTYHCKIHPMMKGTIIAK